MKITIEGTEQEIKKVLSIIAREDKETVLTNHLTSVEEVLTKLH